MKRVTEECGVAQGILFNDGNKNRELIEETDEKHLK